jgi:hypothetical protein
MDAAVDKYFPGVRENANIWSETSAMGWPAGLLLGDAINAGGHGPDTTPVPPRW